ncbi:MAG: DUF1905 domain-containing protein [Dokdonella sp.]
MSLVQFEGVVLSGHKEDAVEVPFDPRERWALESEQLRIGRRACHVHCNVNGFEFKGAVVTRSKKFWLLLPTEIEQAAKVKAGDQISVEIRGG